LHDLLEARVNILVMIQPGADSARGSNCSGSPVARLLTLRVVLALWLSFRPEARAQISAPLPAPVSGSILIAELGCANCHTELRIPSFLKDRIPDLSSAGLRYRAAYLFDYLQSPARVRRHLGRARMPDFHLSAEEALALTAFLETQRQGPRFRPGFPSEVLNPPQAPPPLLSKEHFQTNLSAGLLCLTCHSLEGKGGTQAVDLASISHRLQPEWVRPYLVEPSAFGVPPAVMPAQFYHPSPEGTGYQEIVPQAARRIQGITDFLFSLKLAERTAMEQRLAVARASFPRATAAIGESVFRALNCAACHPHQMITPRSTPAAPDLTIEGGRVQRAWLEGYLKKPVAIRPFGHRPGDGGRMPDFQLSAAEISALGDFLLAQPSTNRFASGDFQPRPLSAFSRLKAKSLLEDKLSCLGCHRLGERGGRIGPDLTNARRRLRGDYVYNIIRDPRSVTLHSAMPRVPLEPATLQLLANFLLQQEEIPQAEGYLSLVENPLIWPGALKGLAGAPAGGVRENYLTHCAACHGAQGQSDGFNARFLPVKPTVHADASHMSKRPDDTLYDGIHSGGALLNRSPMMPPWGESFSPAQIRDLVKYLRTLCRCEGPAWSRDN